MFKSLKTKLLWSHIGAVLVVNLLLGTIGYKSISEYLFNIEAEKLAHTSSHSAEVIQFVLDDMASQLKLIADSSVVVEYFDNYRDLALQEYLAKYQSSFPRIALVNRDGIQEFGILNGTAIEHSKKSHSPDLIERLTRYPNEVLFFGAGTDPDLKIPAVRMALAKVEYFGNKFICIISASVPYTYLATKIHSENIDPNGFVLLTDSKNNSVTVLRAEDGEHLIVEQKPHPAEKSSRFSTIDLEGYDLKRSYIYDIDSLVSSARVPGIDLNVQAVIPYATIYGKLSSIRNNILIILSIIIILTGIFSYLLAHRITQPLSSLIQFSRKVSTNGQGLENIKVDVKSEDEVAELVSSFQTMITKLSRSTVSRNYLDNIIASMNEIVIVIDKDEQITTINRSASNLFFASHREDTKIMLDNVFTDINLTLVRGMIQSGVSQGEIILTDAHDKTRHLLVSVTPIPGRKKNSKETVLVGADISYLKKVERELEDKQNYLTSLMHSMPAGLMIVDADTHIVLDVNPAACEMFGRLKENIVGRVCHKFICPAEVGKCPITDLEKKVEAKEKSIIRQDGASISVLKSVECVKVGDRKLLVESFVDISERKKMEKDLQKSREKLKEIAITDELTGLYNRRGFMTLAEKQLQIANRTKKTLYLLYADLDNMKGINDELGHQIGDKALQDAAEVLKRISRESDIVSRIGGDEFAVLLTGSDNKNAIAERFEKEIQRVNNSSERPYTLSISTGVVSCNPSEEVCDLSKFMSRADSLMYEAKKAKK